ncbi:MAG: hypothetical protein DMG57_42430, partial [Acidobacteria bacterium]
MRKRRLVSFTYEGKPHTHRAGDVASVALLMYAGASGLVYDWLEVLLMRGKPGLLSVLRNASAMPDLFRTLVGAEILS